VVRNASLQAGDAALQSDQRLRKLNAAPGINLGPALDVSATGAAQNVPA